MKRGFFSASLRSMPPELREVLDKNRSPEKRQISRIKYGGVDQRKQCTKLIYFIVFSIKLQIAEDFTQRSFINLKVTVESSECLQRGARSVPLPALFDK